jgi:hypothetical protein
MVWMPGRYLDRKCVVAAGIETELRVNVLIADDGVLMHSNVRLWASRHEGECCIYTLKGMRIVGEWCIRRGIWVALVLGNPQRHDLMYFRGREELN